MEPSPRLDWLVTGHQGRMTERIIALITAAQDAGYVPAMDPVRVKFVLSGAVSLPIVLAAEYRLVHGKDVLSDAFIERHIETCIALLPPGLSTPSYNQDVARPAC